jgi:hypothetical protein
MSHSFIRLGGDSILALRFVAAARRRGFDILTMAEMLRARSLQDVTSFYRLPDKVEPQNLANLEESDEL